MLRNERDASWFFVHAVSSTVLTILTLASSPFLVLQHSTTSDSSDRVGIRKGCVRGEACGLALSTVAFSGSSNSPLNLFTTHHHRLLKEVNFECGLDNDSAPWP
ncbi:hypothetical protein CTAM01_05413 [Colletotrichum tamarilloi]|uniref:Secreted protein n=1 Tax=Colletotrichum tamarilloi TaxID=1209934 RepID=A0ABQ9RDY7_9PEZI|nr:uncharacterized protein CTAM01_05413 [Colletotrichum tamarilloi]KAK1501975.1 hypothetical protein CTAM01_05413 [Colletotrichum tamarilloi]